MKIARREDIRHYIEAKGEVTLLELQEMFPDCSMMTLRRDLLSLLDSRARCPDSHDRRHGEYR